MRGKGSLGSAIPLKVLQRRPVRELGNHGIWQRIWEQEEREVVCEATGIVGAEAGEPASKKISTTVGDDEQAELGDVRGDEVLEEQDTPQSRNQRVVVSGEDIDEGEENKDMGEFIFPRKRKEGLKHWGNVCTFLKAQRELGPALD
ncbi:UNVERIFIED_CONTAM: hypothetical protein FKN15_057752 [Acipenser sinensis]